MAAAYSTDNTEQLQRFINNLWQHQQKNDFCDFTLTTNNTSIECHKLVLSSASSYFAKFLCDSENHTDILDVTPLPEHILRTVVAFMYNSEYVINDENVIELLKFSGTWNLDILAKLCVAYMNDNITINNACRFYNLALDNVDQQKSQNISEFIRENFISLHQSGQLRELSLKNFTTIIEHDEINVKNEDVIFKTAVQIINQKTSVEDINRCLELIRFPHTSGDFLVKVIRTHPLMKDPPRDRYRKEALLYEINPKFVPDVKPRRYWRRGIYYIGTDYCMNQHNDIRVDYCMKQYVPSTDNSECAKMMNLPEWVDSGSSIASHGEHVVIVGGTNGYVGEKRALLLDMTSNTEVRQLPDLPERLFDISVILSDNVVYVVGGNNGSTWSSSVNCLLLGSNIWKTVTLMPQKVCSPLVVQYQQCIYVLGGFNTVHQFSVLKYNIDDDSWEQCTDMPVACSSHGAGVVVHEDRIKVITVDKCLVHSYDTDTWTVKHYNKLGHAVNAFVRNGKIWAVVLNHDTYTYSMMSYDDVDNVWKTEHKSIDNAVLTFLFC